LKILNINNRKE